MSEAAADDEEATIGPVDYLVIEFPGGRLTGEGLPHLIDLVDRGVIRILDLVFVSKGRDGTTRALELRDVDGDGALDLTVFEGASSGLLGDEDLEEAGQALDAGSAAAVMVYENVWAAPLAAALRSGGARMVANGRIPLEDLMSVLGAEEDTAGR
ncbi:DUF6325 family protein [Nocardioides alcanivorans]|uniref:DUF6325 family protein n=1 Tax=Nocardioides alcanivorans TaxID=2897352 RepID=UPI001F43961B|nr:DUF6325 family protein [Nocardioides alcanivorans]